MPPRSQIPTATSQGRRFAVRLALFYSTSFAVIGTHLPFFPVWLKAVGIDPGWIGIICAVPAVTRFTTLPIVTGLAEKRRHAVRAAMILTAIAAAVGFALVGTQHHPIPVLLLYIVTSCFWTPLVPLTDAYALRGVARYGLDYGPLRLWGSVSFIVGALACGLAGRHDRRARADLGDRALAVVAARHRPVAAAARRYQAQDRGRRPRQAVLRDRSFLAIIASAALIQSSHVAYYTFASINWQVAWLWAD